MNTPAHSYLVSLSLSVTVEHGSQITEVALRRLLAMAVQERLDGVSVQDLDRLYLDSWQADDAQRRDGFSSRIILVLPPVGASETAR